MKNEAIKVDELVWQLAGVAHKALKKEKELKNYYPELAPFIEYIVKHYPALESK